MMYVKFHRARDSEIVAVCDKDLIGHELVSGELSLNVSENFYKGELRNKEEVKKILERAVNANLVGNESVGVGIEIGLVDKENMILFGDVPYVQVLVL